MTTLAIVQAAAMEFHRASAEFATSADPFNDRRLEDARRHVLDVIERWGGELREERDQRIKRGEDAVYAALAELLAAPAVTRAPAIDF